MTTTPDHKDYGPDEALHLLQGFIITNRRCSNSLSCDACDEVGTPVCDEMKALATLASLSPAEVPSEVAEALERCAQAFERVREVDRAFGTEAMDEEYHAGCKKLDDDALATLRRALKPQAQPQEDDCEACEHYLTPWKCNGGTEDTPCPALAPPTQSREALLEAVAKAAQQVMEAWEPVGELWVNGRAGWARAEICVAALTSLRNTLATLTNSKEVPHE